MNRAWSQPCSARPLAEAGRLSNWYLGGVVIEDMLQEYQFSTETANTLSSWPLCLLVIPIELRHLKYFVTIAEEGSVSRAAERLNISQPAVSRQLRDLEDELGTPLFDRSSQGPTLTGSGETALLHAKDLLRRANDLMSALKPREEQSRKVLKVGYIPTALTGFLADGMRKFNESNENTCVQIREINPAQQETALREGELDLALLGSACPELQKDYSISPILRVALSVLLPDNHLLALRKSIDLIELADETFVSLNERDFPGRPEMLAELSEKARFPIKVGVKAEGLSEALGMVAGGAGIAVLPEDVANMPHPGVVFVKMKRPRIFLESSAVWKKHGPEPEVVELVGVLKSVTGKKK